MSAPVDGGTTAPITPEPASGRPGRRLVTMVIVVLLIALPLGYLVLSAQESRGSGVEKQRAAARDSLTEEWPSRVQRRIYDVPVPPAAGEVSHFETNSWEQSSLYVEFRTTDKDLNSFLNWVSSDRSELRTGTVTITEEQAAQVGWKFTGADRYSGTTQQQPDRGLEMVITVDLSNEEEPMVYVVSTARF